MSSRWICPHCEHAAFITNEQNVRRGTVALSLDNAEGQMVTSVTYIVCPNPECKKTTVDLLLTNGSPRVGGSINAWGQEFARQRLLPPSYARPLPDYIPQAVRDDYFEACAIADLSPKAAATLARRALQGMVRDYHGIVKRTLNQELTALKGVVDPTVWKAIDAVRSVGNIGAHMEKDINVIVDVEPDEAVRLIRLIEMLVKEWYVARYEREQELAEIIALGDAKQAERDLPALPSSAPADGGASNGVAAV